jgi:hypothetical protein
VAASHERSYRCSGVRGCGSRVMASFTLVTKSSELVYVRQFGNDLKNSLDGWSVQTTNHCERLGGRSAEDIADARVYENLVPGKVLKSMAPHPLV